MLKSFMLIACIELTAASVYAQTVTGIVYEDPNHNAKKDNNEVGIAQVAVSNGTQVVLTDAQGKYELPVSQDEIISVIKPSGYDLPVSAQNLPQFYYTYKPQGGPDFEFETAKPTGKLPKSVDFALYPAEEQDQFTALIFGDPQPYTKEEVDFFAEAIVSEVAGIKNVPFGIVLGDLVGDNLSLYEPYKQAIQQVGIPWFNVMGNHDMNYDATADSLSDETFEATFGPANYAFNYGKVHFIILDDILYPDPQDGEGYQGGFRKDQLDFVENDLKQVPKDHLIVLSFHIPIYESPDWGDTFRDEDRQRLFDILKRFPHTLSLSAHTHLQRHNYLDKTLGWQQDEPHHEYNVGTTSGDWYSGQLNKAGIPISTMRDGTPKGYAFLHFDGNQYTFDYKVAGKPKDYRMQVFAPQVVERNKRTSAGIYANFFQGGEKDSLMYQVDNGPWQGMEWTQDYDPAYLDILHEWDFTGALLSGRRPSNPQFSQHLWRGSIPNDLPAGKHTITVKATDVYGRTFEQLGSYQIKER